MAGTWCAAEKGNKVDGGAERKMNENSKGQNVVKKVKLHLFGESMPCRKYWVNA